ncbi:MAG: glycosyltransferase family 2 protein [Verrucomicrobia bacterium]|nr:MAG: glycosyltransferase family 2 protein [Verrucomicrobiota bacterium]
MLTVGVPVYNAQHLLERCLKNLCAEDLDYRIVISDNASTDKTEEIARAFVHSDSRVRYIRHESNMGAGNNFLFLLNSADTELFAWRAYDDLSSPGYFRSLTQALRENPQSNLAVGGLHYEVTQGQPLPIQPVPDVLPVELARRRKVLLKIAEVTWFYGVFRRGALRKRFVDAQAAYSYVWSLDPLVILPFLLEGSVVTDSSVTFTQYVCGGSAASYRPKGVIACSRLVSQFCRHGFAIANEMATSPGERLRLYADVLRYSNSHGLKFSRIAKRAMLWPYYRLRDRL